MNQLISFNKPLPTSLFWGLLGGATLVLSSAIFNYGLLEIVPYPIILFLTFFTFKPQTANKFKELFLTGFLTLVIMSTILHLGIMLFLNTNGVSISPSGHFWRLGTILGISVICSLLMSTLAIQRK